MDEGKWITLKDGRRIFLKPKEEWEKYWHIDAKQDAVNKVLESNYAGLIIKQNTPKMDVITGGSQIVVYDTNRIKIKK